MTYCYGLVSVVVRYHLLLKITGQNFKEKPRFYLAVARFCRSFLNFVNLFLLFNYFLPMWTWPFIWINLSPLNQGWLVSSLVEIDKCCQCVLCYCVDISPWKRMWPFICTNLNPLHPIMLCGKFGWKSRCGSGDEDFLKFLQCIFGFWFLSPLGRGRGLSFEQIDFLSPKYALS